MSLWGYSHSNDLVPISFWPYQCKTHLVFKYSHSFSCSQHGLKVQVSSKTQGNLLIVAPYNNQRINYMLPTYNGTDSSSPFRKGGMGHSKEILDQSRTGTQRANSKSSILKGPRDPNACALSSLTGFQCCRFDVR